MKKTESLNPCFNGIWYLTQETIKVMARKNPGLNPCFNGIWYLTIKTHGEILRRSNVLILVLMEYDIWHIWGGKP